MNMIEGLDAPESSLTPSYENRLTIYLKKGERERDNHQKGPQETHEVTWKIYRI